MDDAPHVTALAADNELDAEALGFCVDLLVEALHHLVGGEETEVTTLGVEGTDGEVESEFVEEHELPHEGVVPWGCENVP